MALPVFKLLHGATMNHPSDAFLVHSVKISDSAGRERYLEIWTGDIAAQSQPTPVDLLVLSAFPNDYAEVEGTVIHRLSQVGINVEELAKDKAADHRPRWQSWVSKPLVNNSAVKQLICFEPALDERPAHRVGNVFRTVREQLIAAGVSAESPMNTLRIPLLTAGSRNSPREEMVEAILSQGWLHLGAGLPVKRLQLFLGLRDRGIDNLLVEAGIQLEKVRQRWVQDFINSPTPDFDLFISYRHADDHILHNLSEELQRRRPEMRLFIDKERLQPGGYWKQDLIRGLSRSRQALCFITADYPNSVECMDEFHASVLWNEIRPRFLVPVLNMKNHHIANLPESIKRVHCITADLPDQSPQELASEIFRLIV